MKTRTPPFSTWSYIPMVHSIEPYNLKRTLLQTLIWILASLALGAILALCSQAVSAKPAEPPLVQHAGAMATRHGVSPALLKTICHVESDWQSRDGAAGEKGVCQIKPATVLTFCPKCYTSVAKLLSALNDAHSNIELAAMYLAYLQRRVGTDPILLASAYNGGPAGPVRYLMKIRETMPLYARTDL